MEIGDTTAPAQRVRHFWLLRITVIFLFWSVRHGTGNRIPSNINSHPVSEQVASLYLMGEAPA
jgi:hypothetical protein